MVKINKKPLARATKKTVIKGKKPMKNGTQPFKKKGVANGSEVFKKKNDKKHGKEEEILNKTDESMEDFSLDEEESDKENASDISFTMSDAENLTDSETEAKVEAEDDSMSDASENDDEEDDEDGDEEDGDEKDRGDEKDSDESGSEAEEDHMKALKRLKETDPEFYKYLEENDKKLLDFNVSDGEDDDEDGDESMVHKPSEELEIASDESDFEPEGDEDKQVDSSVITLKMLKQWQADIQTDKTNKTMVCLMQAFNAALARVMSNEEVSTFYKVDGSAVFNAVIQICVLELGPAIRRFLGLKPGSKLAPHKCKKFVKINSMLKGYFTDLFKLLTSVTSTNILNILLKHLHYMSPMIVSFGSISKPLLKKLIQLWGTADESVRVIAFLCILRITHNQQQVYLDTVLKSMYMTYVKNSKFVSVNTLPGINFMRRSLVEIYSLDLNVSYTHVFLFIRQLAIQLRTGITMKKKENLQAIYNWQFINSLKLWGSLLGATCNKPQLQPLVYPFVQVCIGTIKMSPNPSFYPLRFHVTKILIDLSKETGVFIPVMPFLLEVLTSYNFNKEHKKVSMKPLNFIALLRLSKHQLSENGFKDAVIETIYGQLLEYLASHSQSIAFPELALLCKIQLKEFTKQCHTVNYQRKISQILEKINQTSEFIGKERKKVNFPLKQFKQIDAWETTIKNSGTPLITFYESWNKMNHMKKKKQVTNNEALGDYNLPKLKKNRRENVQREKAEEVTLFPSDSEDDDLVLDKDKVNKDGKKKRTRGGKKGKKSNEVTLKEQEIIGEGDVVEDFKLDDW